MAIHRGIQSAIFFYLSCAPCTGYSYRQKRRKEATRDRADKQALEMEQPGLYRHPSPFATNPHWQAEINLGPTPAPAKRRGNQKKGRARTSDENASNVASSVNLALALAPGDSNDSAWNLRNWQREDEPLWGSSHPDGRAASVTRPSTLSRPPTARTATTDRSGASSYYSTLNPPINDMHPPVVTRIDTREDAMWMLQPPPPARVMNGSARPSRNPSASGSGSSSRRSRPASRRPVTDDAPQSRQSQRTDERRRGRGGHLSPAAATQPRESGRSTALARQDHDDDDDTDADADDDDAAAAPPARDRSKRRRRPPPISVSEDSPSTSPSRVARPPTLVEPPPPGPDHDTNRSPRPLQHTKRHLSPIVSSNASPDRSRSRSSDSQVRSLAPRPAATRQDSSLNVLQELVPANLLNVQKLSKSPSFEARIELPSSDEYEEMMLLGSGKAGFDSWYESRDFTTFPQWAAERVTRDVSSRWSVDF